MARARHEAAWTHESATVRGSKGRNRGWVMLAVGFVAIAGLSIFGYNRLMNFQDVTFELRYCQQPLTQESTWPEVQAAACDPVDIDAQVLTRWSAGDQTFADTAVGSSWTFDSVPVDTVVNALELELAEPAQTVVVAEPGKESVRAALTTDTAGTTWTGYIGDRAETTMWVLVTP